MINNLIDLLVCGWEKADQVCLGKNFLSGRIKPKRLKTVMMISGGNKEETDSGGKVELRKIQDKK